MDVERRDAERRVYAEMQVEAFLQILAKRYGFKPEDVPEILDDLRWMRKHRAGLNRVSWSVALGIVALGITGLWQALLEGVKHFIKGM